MSLPSQVFLEITRSCNQACPFCSCPWFAEHSAPDRPEMELPEWLEATTELIANGVSHIAVTGGEPTLAPDAPQLMRHIAEQLRLHHPEGSTTLALFTNGSDVGDEWFELLLECQAELYTSLPGLSTFPQHTGCPDADFRSLLSFIHEASMREIHVSVGVTITRTMLPELYETLSYAVLSGAQTVILNPFKPSGRGLSHPDLLLSNQETLQAASIAEEVAAKCEGICTIGGEFPPIAQASNYPHLLLENTCVAARESFTVAPDGWLHVCEHDPTPICHWRDWRTLQASPKWCQFATRIQSVCPL